MVRTLRQPTDRELYARMPAWVFALEATCIDLQCDCCDVTSISVRNTHECVVKKNKRV